LLIAIIAQAQFKPSDVGYKIEMQHPYEKMKVVTSLQTILDMDGYTTPHTLGTFTEQGWITATVYLQDSTLADDERSPEMKDTYNCFSDGRILAISMEGYDIYSIAYGFEYDKKEKLIASVIASAAAREYTYVYDKADNIIKRNGKGTRWVYADENDTEGKLVMVDLEVNDYKWDKSGNLLSDTFLYTGEWTTQAKYSYNDKHQLIGTAIYYENNVDAQPAFTIEYSYDNNGFLISTITKEDGFTLTNLFTYTYK